MSTRRKNVGECIYCGQQKELTVDHIPPKCLFPKPRPNNLITVPSCSSCNSGESKDDEYFRMMLTFSIEASQHPEIKNLIPTILRSLNKPEKFGFSQAFYKTLSDVELQTKSGLYLGKTAKYQADEKRLNRVVNRILKGLFYHEIGSRLPDKYEVCTYSHWIFRDMLYIPPDIIDNLQKTLAMLDPIKPKIIGNDIFSYKYCLPCNADQNNSIWLFTFFNKIDYLCTTDIIEYP
jgi:hypothetical protein